MAISHIFFGLHNVLVKSQKLKAPYSHALARYMAINYGGELQRWQQAHEQIAAHRRDYYIDLNLSNDEDLQDYYEGLFRVTRALFTLTKTPEPPKSEISRLSKMLPALPFEAPTACYTDVIPTLKHLTAHKYSIGLISHTLSAQAAAILEATQIRHFFTAPIIGVDTTEQFEKNARYFATLLRLADVPANQCLIVDKRKQIIREAKRAGMHALLLQRDTPDTMDTLQNLQQILDYVPIRKPTSKIDPSKL